MDKKLRFIELKSINEESKIIEAYVSTYDWDRMDERFIKGSWRLGTFKKSPVVLWAHNYEMPPIAKALEIEEDDKGLKAKMQFDEQDEFAMKIFSLFKRGFLNSFSVGFRPLKYMAEQIEGKNEKGIVWTDAELLEFSAVPVPANPQATMTRADADIMVKALKNYKIEEIEGSEEVKICPACDDSKVEGIEDKPNSIVEKPKEEPKEEPKQEEKLEETLKNLVDLAKVIKGKKLDDSKLSLMKMSISTLNEIIVENTETVTKKDFDEMKAIVNSLSDFIKNNRPDAQDIVSKFMNQFEIAIKSYQEK